MTRQSITFDQIASFEVDDSDGRLYWRGKGVVLERRVILRGFELFLASIAAIGALLAGVHPFGASFGYW
jgi:hypothetical protein